PPCGTNSLGGVPDLKTEGVHRGDGTPLRNRMIQMRANRAGELDGHLAERAERGVAGAPEMLKRPRIVRQLRGDGCGELVDERLGSIEECRHRRVALDRCVVAPPPPGRAEPPPALPPSPVPTHPRINRL